MAEVRLDEGLAQGRPGPAVATSLEPTHITNNPLLVALPSSLRPLLANRATVLTALLYPGLFFGTFFVLNIINWANQSTDAVPFTSMCVVIILWFGVSVPLVFLGSYFGYKKDAIEFPTATSNIPRQIPEQSWFMNAGMVMIIGGEGGGEERSDGPTNEISSISTQF